MLSQGQTLRFSDLTYKNGIYYSGDSLANGRVEDTNEYGRVRAVAFLKDGYLNGRAKLFYSTGQMHMLQEFKEGALSSVFRAYYPNGELQLKALVKGPNPKGGGHLLKDVYYGYYSSEDSTYTLKNVPWKVLHLLVGDLGYTEFNNHIPFHQLAGFRLSDGRRKGRGLFLPDSRDMFFPDKKPVN